MGKLLERLDPAMTGMRNLGRGRRKGEAPGHSNTVKLKPIPSTRKAQTPMSDKGYG